MDVLKLENVSKQFGTLKVINDLSFSVPEHSMFGLIGKNGAGKTTTMKMILGFLNTNAGQIYVCDEKVVFGNTMTKRHIGYLPDVPVFYGYMKPTEYLHLCGKLSGLTTKKIQERTKELLNLTGLEEANRKIKGFSRGMKQRLGIAQALLNEPKLLICDEPFSSLDPIGRKEILEILSIARERTTIVFSTHILSDVERICDRVGVINNGKLALSGNLLELKELYHKDTISLKLQDENNTSRLTKILSTLPQVYNVEKKGPEMTIKLNEIDMVSPKILKLIIKENMHLLKYEELEPSLENVFMEVVQ